MVKRIAAIGLIYVIICAAWMFLGGTLHQRSQSFDRMLSSKVAGLWGSPQVQTAPEIRFGYTTLVTETQEQTDPVTKKTKLIKKKVERTHWSDMPLAGSDIQVDFDLEHRQKGLLWYSTYKVDFTGRYKYVHKENRVGWVDILYKYPTSQATYDDFKFEIVGAEPATAYPTAANQTIRMAVKPGQEVVFDVSYTTRGLTSWLYDLGKHVSQISDFSLDMTTNFKAIDFPDRTMSPSAKTETDNGWNLSWEFSSLVSGFDIGMIMPAKINPGPLAAQISFFAPVSLLFFFIWMFVISVLKKIDLHPMNYLFLGASFFAFHLLFSYTVDRIDLLLAFGISSGVSVFLVISYLRLVVGLRFAAVEAGLSQVVYLVLFSYAHFYEGWTGLMVTIGSILTLFVVMQLTGRINWSEVFAPKTKPPSEPPKARPVP